MPLTAQQKDAKPPNPLPELMSELSYDVLYSAQCQIQAFEGIIQDMADSSTEAWTKWATCAFPEDDPLPGEWEQSLSDF